MRTASAPAANATAATPSGGCSGAKVPVAPEAPSSATTTYETRLGKLVYNFRIEGVVDFDRALGRFSAIRHAGRPTPSRAQTAEGGHGDRES